MSAHALPPLPPLFENWNPAMRGAYLKGRTAFTDGNAIETCPYKDKRKLSGGLSWSRAFIRAWEDGYRDAERFAEHLQAAAIRDTVIQGHG